MFSQPSAIPVSAWDVNKPLTFFRRKLRIYKLLYLYGPVLSWIFFGSGLDVYRYRGQMFTGIIEAIGTVRSVSGGGDNNRIAVELALVGGDVGPGDSIAVNGVCLTVTTMDGSVASFDVSGRTIADSTLGGLRAGAKVNLERAMAANGRFGGHIVQGHVDGIATVRTIKRTGQFVEITFTAKIAKTTRGGLTDAMVPKGSVAIDGVSLTVARLEGWDFAVTVIPTTWENTTLSRLKAGDAVNIENDIIVKTVQGHLEKILGTNKGITAEKLRELGF